MAPKKADKIENPPVASSSEEEDEQSGSSGEESDSSDEEAGDVRSKLTQKPSAPPAAKKKPESDSEEGESESESDSDSEPATKTKPLNTVATKQIPPESSKRSLKQSDNNEPKKKAKTSSTTEQVQKEKNPSTSASAGDEEVKKISGEEAKKMFQRLFSESDEIAMLQGFLDFTSTKGDPSENMDAFCDYVKTLIDYNASKAQIVTKLQRCKKKFVNIVKNALKKGKTEDKITCAKDFDQKAFELSRKIWGSDGVLPAKPRKEVVKETRNKVNSVDTHHLSESGEMGLFFKGENGSVLGLDESSVSEFWDVVEDGAKKREMEEKVKKLKATQMELCLQRTALVDYSAKMIFKNNASSSS
ncbi:GLABROUS1 enhancer-binding protein-like [Hirschfeldia incana]|nr:GLABROUS1 enhancer-binding protein-like [Hirschfeldia incana]